MAAHATGGSSRKPSDSSTHSGRRSPSSASSNAQPQRKKSETGTAADMPRGDGGLSPGWQVWGSENPGVNHNPSVPSGPNANDLVASQPEPTFRGNRGEGWSLSGPRPATWADDVEALVNLNSAQHPHALRHAVQRPPAASEMAAFATSRPEERQLGDMAVQLPQRYDSQFFANAAPPSVSTSTYGNLSNISQQAPNQRGPGPYNGTPSGTEGDIALILRAEDNYNDIPQTAHQRYINGINGIAPNGRHGPPHAPQHSSDPYNAYRTGYPPYHSSAPTRELYPNYQHGGFDTYRGPSDAFRYGSAGTMPPSPAPGYYAPPLLHTNTQQSNMFYDYGAPHSPASPVYFPSPPPMLYTPQHSPIPSQPPNPVAQGTRPEVRYDTHRQITSHPLTIYPSAWPATPPLSQAFAPTVHFGMLHPLLHATGMYGLSPQALQIYHRNAQLRVATGTNDSSALVRSPLLEEFRADRSRRWTLRDIVGHVVEFSGDQHGSRFVQQKFETSTSEEKQLTFDEIVPANTLQLIQDVYGNYVIQKMFEHGTQAQKTILANTIEGHVLSLSLQMYGCRVIQKAIEYVLPEQQSSFVRELEPHALKLVKDPNGNHVIEKLISHVAPERLTFVDTFRPFVYDLATHPYGCRVLQRCYEYLPEERMRPLMDEVHRHSINLMQNQFGNYVVQFVLERGTAQDRDLIICKLRGKMLHMARHKFASNVCEKALVTADSESRHALIDEIMAPNQDGVTPILMMMKNQFSNYVLQRALSVAEGEQKRELISLVKPQLANVRRFSSTHSKHLAATERLCTT